MTAALCIPRQTKRKEIWKLTSIKLSPEKSLSDKPCLCLPQSSRTEHWQMLVVFGLTLSLGLELMTQTSVKKKLAGQL